MIHVQDNPALDPEYHYRPLPRSAENINTEQECESVGWVNPHLPVSAFPKFMQPSVARQRIEQAWERMKFCADPETEWALINRLRAIQGVM